MNGNYRRVFCGLGIAVIFAVLALGPSPIRATPFTDHFDALIADLQARAGALSNSVDATEQKQYKAIQKVLTTLVVNDSTSLATDIKNLGSAAKGLVKVFPTEFFPPSGVLLTNFQATVNGLAGEVQDTIDTTQTTIDGLPAGSCKDKANLANAAAQALLDSATSSLDMGVASKLLASALKAATKASAAAAKCLSSGGGGGGSGDFMNATVGGDISSSFHSDFPTPVYTISADRYDITGGDANGLGITLVVSNVVGVGTYPLASSSTLSRVSPLAAYLGAVGSVTFTTYNPGQKQLAGTFSFTATRVLPDTNGAVSVSSGSFSSSTLATVP